MERSVFSDRLVFVEALRDNSQLTPMELAVYRNWFEFSFYCLHFLTPTSICIFKYNMWIQSGHMLIQGMTLWVVCIVFNRMWIMFTYKVM